MYHIKQRASVFVISEQANRESKTEHLPTAGATPILGKSCCFQFNLQYTYVYMITYFDFDLWILLKKVINISFQNWRDTFHSRESLLEDNSLVIA